MHELVNFIVETVSSWGYLGIFVMMFFESTVVPVPSELAMIPAGYLVSLGKMDMFLAFWAGTLWALWGSLFNYFAWMYLGAPIIKKLIHLYGKYLFLSEKSYMVTEKFFKQHGNVTVFTWRFIPWVRHLISIPAWIFSMDIYKFVIYTFLWAWAWNIILLYIGYIAWENQELIRQYSDEVTIGLVIFLVVLIWSYISLQSKKK